LIKTFTCAAQRCSQVSCDKIDTHTAHVCMTIAFVTTLFVPLTQSLLLAGGQNSAQAQQLLLLRQQMRVFEEQLPRALQGPCIGHQEHLSVQQVAQLLLT
jgi:hypothetical protein